MPAASEPLFPHEEGATQRKPSSLPALDGLYHRAFRHGGLWWGAPCSRRRGALCCCCCCCCCRFGSKGGDGEERRCRGSSSSLPVHLQRFFPRFLFRCEHDRTGALRPRISRLLQRRWLLVCRAGRRLSSDQSRGGGKRGHRRSSGRADRPRPRPRAAARLLLALLHLALRFLPPFLLFSFSRPRTGTFDCCHFSLPTAVGGFGTARRRGGAEREEEDDPARAARGSGGRL